MAAASAADADEPPSGDELLHTAAATPSADEEQEDCIDLRPLVVDESWRRRTRTVQRFWLWFMLEKNPSLQLERKHTLHYVAL